MKKTTVTLLLILCSLFIISAYGQNINFEYDKSGNLIKRTLAVATRSLSANEVPKEIIQ